MLKTFRNKIRHFSLAQKSFFHILSSFFIFAVLHHLFRIPLQDSTNWRVAFSFLTMLPLHTIDEDCSSTNDTDDVIVVCALDRLNVLLEKESKPAYFPIPTRSSDIESMNSIPEVYTTFQGTPCTFRMDGHSIRLKCIDWICKLQHHFRKNGTVAHVAMNYLDRFLCHGNKEKQDISNLFIDSSVDILTLLTTMAFDCAIRLHADDSGDGVRSAYDCAERELGVNPLYRCDEEKHKIKRCLIRKKLESTNYYNRDGFHSLLEAYKDIVEATYSHGIDIPSLEDCSKVQYAMMIALDWFLDPPLASGYVHEMMNIVSSTIDAIVVTRHFSDGFYDRLQEDIMERVNTQLTSFVRSGFDLPHEGPFVIAYAAMLNAFDFALSSLSSSDRNAKEALSSRLEFHCRIAMNKAFKDEKRCKAMLHLYNDLDLNWKNVIQSQSNIKSDRLGQVANMLFYLYQRQTTHLTDWRDHEGSVVYSKNENVTLSLTSSPVGDMNPVPSTSLFIPNTPEHDKDDFELDCLFRDHNFKNEKLLSDRAPSAAWSDGSSSETNTSIFEEDHGSLFPFFNSSVVNFSEMIPNDCKHRVVSSSYGNML